MAAKEVITGQPTSPVSPVTQEMLHTMNVFKKLGIEPKGDTPEDLKAWMKDYLRSQGELPAATAKQSTADLKFTLPPKPTTTKMMMNHPPKITWFSGTEPKSGDTTYELWRHEVKCLLKQNYEPDAILNAVHRSLRGEAGLVAMRLDLDASVNTIVQKLDSIYGSVDKKEELLAEFYGSRQKSEETVTSWSCRLESIIGKAVDRGIVQREDVDGMLHSMLWTGLKSSLKNISGHKYDTVTHFDGLRVALRQIESDQIQRESAKQKPQTSKVVTGQSDLTEIKGMIQQLTTRMNTYEKKPQFSYQSRPSWQSQPQQQRWRQHDYQQQQQQQQFAPQQHQPSHWQQQQQPLPAWQESGNQPQHRNRGGNRGRGNSYNAPRQQTEPQQGEQQEYICWRCGQKGHLKRGCKIRLDHSQHDLNAKKPMQGEHS